MKRILCISLCFSIAILAFENALVFFSFTIHQDQFTEAYCIDKYSTDQVMCSGRCVLELQLSDYEGQHNGEQQMGQQQHTLSVSYVVPDQFNPMVSLDDHSTANVFPVSVVEDQLHLSALFRPPIS